MLKKKYTYLSLVLVLLFANSCKVLYPGMMFQQKDYQVFELRDKLIDEYIIKPGDEITIDFFTREGASLIERHVPTTANNTGGLSQSSLSTYFVNSNGYVRLPFIGDFNVQGYTVNKLQRVVESELSRLYVEPYCVIRVVNRRVFLFKGYSGSIVELNQNPTHLIEVIAKSGGIDKELKAYKIKVIRGDLKNPTIYNIDLSTINGMSNSDIVLQSCDIIYIEPRRRVITDSFREITTIVSSITSLISIIFIINRLK